MKNRSQFFQRNGQTSNDDNNSRDFSLKFSKMCRNYYGTKNENSKLNWNFIMCRNLNEFQSVSFNDVILLYYPYHGSGSISFNSYGKPSQRFTFISEKGFGEMNILQPIL